MKVLMSAFSCGPGKGSEPGVGWNMAVEVARLGHQVLVLTQPEFKADIERQVASGTVPPGLRFDIYMPTWLARLRDFGLRHGQGALTWHVVSVLWQVCILFRVRRHFGPADFDLIHHVTFAGIRHPTLLTLLKVPTVLGPLGGGDTIPFKLRKSFPWRHWCAELGRDLHNWALRADPMTRSAFHRARLIFLRTEAGTVAVPRRDRHKVRVCVGLGAADMPLAKASGRQVQMPLRLLYVGGLVYLKGVHLALRALAYARRRGCDAELTIVGDGPARAALEQLTLELELGPHVTFRGALARDHLLPIYRSHDTFLFPSMRDAGGMVVLEAWSQALPVICFDLGGPGKMVDETCGRVVSATGSEAQCVAALGEEITALAFDEALRMSLARGAVCRFRAFSWQAIVAGLYSEIEQQVTATHDGSKPFGTLESTRPASEAERHPALVTSGNAEMSPALPPESRRPHGS